MNSWYPCPEAGQQDVVRRGQFQAVIGERVHNEQSAKTAATVGSAALLLRTAVTKSLRTTGGDPWMGLEPASARLPAT